MELYSIGKLSKIVNITPDTLRYYDEINLFKPSHTSPETGYRYYTLDQAKDLSRILELKEFDFSLAEIKKIMEQPIKLEMIYRKRYGELMHEKQRISQAMQKLANKLKSQEEESLMSKKLLLVDDAAFMRMMLKDICVKNGFEIAGEAEDGEKGVEMYKQLNPDLVVLNITMPKMDGIEALRKIREYNPQARAVMCSALGQPVCVAEALIAGARRFVVKPFQSEKFIDDIRFTLLEENPPPLNETFLQTIIQVAKENPNTHTILSQDMIDEIIYTTENFTTVTPETGAFLQKLAAYIDMPTSFPYYYFPQNKTDDSLPAEDIPGLLAEAQKHNPLAPDKPFRSPDPVLNALEKLAAGQEKMTELLERLVTKQ